MHQKMANDELQMRRNKLMNICRKMDLLIEGFPAGTLQRNGILLEEIRKSNSTMVTARFVGVLVVLSLTDTGLPKGLAWVELQKSSKFREQRLVYLFRRKPYNNEAILFITAINVQRLKMFHWSVNGCNHIKNKTFHWQGVICSNITKSKVVSSFLQKIWNSVHLRKMVVSKGRSQVPCFSVP